MYVKLEEAKKHLLLDDSFKDDDLYILGLIDVAEDAVARNLNLKLDELAVDGEFTPPAVIHAILLLIGNLYANREPVSYSSVNTEDVFTPEFYFLIKNTNDNEVTVEIRPAGQEKFITTVLYPGWNPELCSAVRTKGETGLQYGY